MDYFRCIFEPTPVNDPTSASIVPRPSLVKGISRFAFQKLRAVAKYIDIGKILAGYNTVGLDGVID